MPAKVLLVEDNADNRHIYTVMLEHFGYEVLVATDGEEGVRAALDTVPALILMDISLPLLDGYAATRILKADERTRRVPILALTAHVLPEERERAFAAGCDDYLAKPVSPQEVLSQVRRWIGAAG